MAGDPAFMIGPEVLARGAGSGPLVGRTFAVKDLVDVAGTRTGAGTPAWLADAPVAEHDAPVVSALLAAGADLVGKTVTDELAFSLSGTNVHYGTPPNPAGADRVPGGSSSGSASAVARDVVDLGVGTDTGGSIRVPASYCGIVGLRPSHGRVPLERVVPLAPSFDTLGLLTRTGADLADGWAALAPIAPWSGSPVPDVAGIVVADDLFDLADPRAVGPLHAAVETVAATTGLPVRHERLGHELAWLDAFRAIQLYEAWQALGSWISLRHPDLGPGVAARFEAASHVTEADAQAATSVREHARTALAELVGGGWVMAQPATTGPAPLIDTPADESTDLRNRTMQLTCTAGLAGAPVVSLPLATVDGLPVGLAVVGAPGTDEALVDLAATAVP